MLLNKDRLLMLAILSLWGAAWVYADTSTTRIGLVLPTVGAVDSTKSWGQKMNENFDDIDGSVAVLDKTNAFTLDNTFASSVAIGTTTLTYKFYVISAAADWAGYVSGSGGYGLAGATSGATDADLPLAALANGNPVFSVNGAGDAELVRDIKPEGIRFNNGSGNRLYKTDTTCLSGDFYILTSTSPNFDTSNIPTSKVCYSDN